MDDNGITFVILEDTLPVPESQGQILVNVDDISAIRDVAPMGGLPTSVIYLRGGHPGGQALRAYGSAIEIAGKVVKAIVASFNGDPV